MLACLPCNTVGVVRSYPQQFGRHLAAEAVAARHDFCRPSSTSVLSDEEVVEVFAKSVAGDDDCWRCVWNLAFELRVYLELSCFELCVDLE